MSEGGSEGGCVRVGSRGAAIACVPVPVPAQRMPMPCTCLTVCLAACPACPLRTACRERFELAHLPAASNEADGEAAAAAGASGAPAVERYRFSRCRRPLPAAVMAKLGVPLPEGERTVLHDDLGWEEIQVGGWRGGWAGSRLAVVCAAGWVGWQYSVV